MSVEVGTDEIQHITWLGKVDLVGIKYRDSSKHQHIKVDFLQTLSLMKKQVRYLMNKVVLVNPQW